MIEVPVYVPATGGAAWHRMGEHLLATLAPHSAIVGSGEDPEPNVPPRMVVVYYEGNLYNATNMVTFTDRAMFAYWRMRDHYPTVAMMAVPRNQLAQAGTLYPEYGRIEVADVHEQIRLCRWLEIPIENSDRLAREMRVLGVRIGAPS